jgi:hypothetical protein
MTTKLVAIELYRAVMQPPRTCFQQFGVKACQKLKGVQVGMPENIDDETGACGFENALRRSHHLQATQCGDVGKSVDPHLCISSRSPQQHNMMRSENIAVLAVLTGNAADSTAGNTIKLRACGEGCSLSPDSDQRKEGEANGVEVDDQKSARSVVASSSCPSYPQIQHMPYDLKLHRRSHRAITRLRKKFMDQVMSYLGVPYHKRFHQDPSSAHYKAPL